ncbi:MAG: hypothetical protein ACYTG7_24975, partial [Planctomycetota bacterium]
MIDNLKEVDTMVKFLAALVVIVLAFGWAAPTAMAMEQAGTDTPPSSVWSSTARYLVEHAFEFAILLVFLGAILSSYLSRRLRDRCLKHFEGFPITLECKDGRRYRGNLDAENNGLEIFYHDEEREGADSPRESFLLYQGEYAQLQALVSYPELLNERQQNWRKRAIKHAYAPGLFRRLRRRIRNFYAAIKDALSEAFMLILGRMKTVGPQAEVLSSQEKHVNKMGLEVVGAVAAASFDPILERQIGKRVLAEVVGSNNQKQYHEGFLREYSKDFIELQDVLYPDIGVAALPADGSECASMGMNVQRQGNELQIENRGSMEIQVDITPAEDPAEGADTMESSQIRVLPGEQKNATIPQHAQPMNLRTTVQKKADVLLPRHSAIVRHRVRDLLSGKPTAT